MPEEVKFTEEELKQVQNIQKKLCKYSKSIWTIKNG